ncbi:unnamed protein product, partial [Rotaria sordida]
LSNNNKMSSMIQTELINNNQIKTTNEPHDHQLPTVIPVHHDYLMDMSNIGYPIHNQFPSLPLKRQSLITSSYSIEQLQQLYCAHSSSTNDLSSYDYHSWHIFFNKNSK